MVSPQCPDQKRCFPGKPGGLGQRVFWCLLYVWLYWILLGCPVHLRMYVRMYVHVCVCHDYQLLAVFLEVVMCMVWAELSAACRMTLCKHNRNRNENNVLFSRQPVMGVCLSMYVYHICVLCWNALTRLIGCGGEWCCKYVHLQSYVRAYVCTYSSLYVCDIPVLLYVRMYVCVFCTVWPSHCLFHVVSDCFWNYTYMYVHTYSLFYVRICFWVCSTPGMSPSAHLLEFLFEIITSKWVMLAVTAVITVLT